MNFSITDVPGITVGHWTDNIASTGCTVILCNERTVGGVDVRGSSPGTRETDILGLGKRVEVVHAVMLSGGSAFGLAAAEGAMKYLEEQRIGVLVGSNVVPIVSSAIIFDLGLGDGQVRPDLASGYFACKEASSDPVEQGSVGAGAGASVGKVLGPDQATKGGIGTSSIDLGNGLIVGAIVVVNAIGSVHDPETGELLAGPRLEGGEMASSMEILISGEDHKTTGASSNTTIGAVATNAKLSKSQANRLASSAHNGLALAVRPSHLIGDGDTMFGLATCEKPFEEGSLTTSHEEFNRIIAASVRCTSEAIVNAVQFAKGVDSCPSINELDPKRKI